MVQINFNAGENTGQGTWTPLPEGDYEVEIEDVEVTTSGSGNPQLQLSYKLMDGPREGGTAKDWYSLLPQSGWRLRGLLDALGIEYTAGGKDGDGRDAISFEGDDLIGRRVLYFVAQREYNGKVNNDFKNPRDPDAGGDQAQAQPAQQQQQQAAPSNARGRRPRPSR